MARILIVVSAAEHWTQADGTAHPSGFWAEELVVPHEKFTRADHTVDIATPGGRAPTADQASFNPDVAGPGVAHYQDYLATIAGQLNHPLTLADIDPSDYEAIVIPGGHGPMEDLAVDDAMARILLTAASNDTLIAAVCHGPAALLSVTADDGSWPFADRQLTALTDEEETLFGTAGNAKWLLEFRLRERGAKFSSGTPWQPYVIVDGQLITGQNPASSGAMADTLLDRLAHR